MKITQIERFDLDIPYVERVREHLQKGWGLANRATDDEFQANKEEFLRQWKESSPPSVQASIYRVHTDEGLVGVGEGSALSEDQLQTYVGKSPFEYIMDDGVGPLQVAFYDLMGQALSLPMARLFGPCRERAPMAYWSHCFPPEILREEARIAASLGFRAHKFKRRAHTDVIEQVAAISEVAPDDYEITADANQTFGTLERALAIGRELKRYPRLKCLESPIDQADVEGYLTLKQELGYPLAIHFGVPDRVVALSSGAYDYFILSGGAGNIMRNAHIAQAGDKPFWIQTGGFTDITAYFLVHLAAAIPNATLGHVCLYMLLEGALLKEPLEAKEGYIDVPAGPGLGAELDMDAIDRYRVG